MICAHCFVYYSICCPLIAIDLQASKHIGTCAISLRQDKREMPKQENLQDLIIYAKYKINGYTNAALI